MASWRFDLHFEEDEDQGLWAGTENPIPRVVGVGVVIDLEAVRSNLSPDGIAGAGAEVGVVGLAASVTVDQRALHRQLRQDSPLSR